MEIGPIIRSLARTKIRFLLIALEVALTLAVIVNCVNMIKDTRWRMVRPTGMDEANIVTILSQPFAGDFKEDGYLDNSRKADLEMLRTIPGIRVAEAISQIPLSGSGSSSGYKPLGSEMNTLGTAVFSAGPDILEVLGVHLIEGRTLREDDINDSESKNVIVTKAFADRLFPDGNALGQQLQGRTPENPDTIVGIVEEMHGSWPTWRYFNHVMLRPGKPGSFNFGVRYLLRVQPGQASLLIPTIEEKLLSLNNGRILRIETLAGVKAETFKADLALIKIFGSVIFLLIFVTALGIIGITSFSVTERTRHIGTRRALGASRGAILRYFLTENWIITSSGLILGIGLAYGFNYVLVSMLSGVKLEWQLVVYGVALMWLIGQLSALMPALRGSRISPAIATKTV